MDYCHSIDAVGRCGCGCPSLLYIKIHNLFKYSCIKSHNSPNMHSINFLRESRIIFLCIHHIHINKPFKVCVHKSALSQSQWFTGCACVVFSPHYAKYWGIPSSWIQLFLCEWNTVWMKSCETSVLFSRSWKMKLPLWLDTGSNG